MRAARNQSQTIRRDKHAAAKKVHANQVHAARLMLRRREATTTEVREVRVSIRRRVTMADRGEDRVSEAPAIVDRVIARHHRLAAQVALAIGHQVVRIVDLAGLVVRE